MDSSEDEAILIDEKSDEDTDEIKNINEFCGFESIAEFSKNGMQQIVETTKRVNAFPSGASRDLYNAYAGFTKIVDFESSRIVQIIGKILNHQQIVGNIQRRDYDEKFELLLEANDVILERVNSNLDVLAGIRKMPETILIHTELPKASLPLHKVSSSWNNSKKAESPIAIRTAKLITAKNIVRPQINFKIPVDNSDSAFEPRLKYKPNSIKPLAILAEYDTEGNIQSYLHPYEIELNKFEPDASQLMKVEPIKSLDITQTPLVYIDNVVKLNEALQDFINVTEIAVDVEHHSYRTFQGITCLLQISTREKDYIFDTLLLRDDLHVLNEVFTKKNIVKVFHGAESDIQWLQRDLSLYIVNMFDTHQAAKRLNLARLSLAYLLKYYCKIDLDKTFQLADWRIRPLPEELIDYARKDTHYLLYIYDLMKNELIKQNNGQTILLSSVYQASTDICKMRFFKPQILPQSHLDVYHKSKRIFDNRQLYAFKEIFDWRDKIARIEDESFSYVLPNHMMLQISESLPREMQGILACCNPIPPLVRQSLNTLHQIVLKAREQSLVKPIANENTNRNVITNNKDINNPLYCPHDLSHANDFRDDMPTLINDTNLFKLEESKLTTSKPVINVFLTPNNSDNEDEDVKTNANKIKAIKFVSPYERYKLVLPFIEQQRLDELEKAKNDKPVKLLCPAKVESDPELVISINDETTTETLKKLCKRKWENNSNKNGNQKYENKKSKIEKAVKEVEIEVEVDGKPEEAIEIADDLEIVEVADKVESDLSQSASDNKLNPKNRKPKKKKLYSNNATKQASSAPIEFDYSKVDFKKFQGGSQKLSKNDVKSKFEGKNNKNNKHNNKKFNKLFTFSNIKAKR